MDNVEDIKAEVKELADFLNNGCFGHGNSEPQRNLVIELTVMKLKALAKE